MMSVEGYRDKPWIEVRRKGENDSYDHKNHIVYLITTTIFPKVSEKVFLYLKVGKDQAFILVVINHCKSFSVYFFLATNIRTQHTTRKKR